jgi:HSP20 family protein
MKNVSPWRRRIGGALEPLRQEMDDLFTRFFGEALEGRKPDAWAPRIDVEETERDVVIRADLPGVGPEDVDVSIADGSLVLRGEKREEHLTEKKNFLRAERFVGLFYRAVPLPPGLDTERIVATSSKGVLTVTIPKAAQALPKKVVVQAKD